MTYVSWLEDSNYGDYRKYICDRRADDDFSAFKKKFRFNYQIFLSLDQHLPDLEYVRVKLQEVGVEGRWTLVCFLNGSIIFTETCEDATLVRLISKWR